MSHGMYRGSRSKDILFTKKKTVNEKFPFKFQFPEIITSGSSGLKKIGMLSFPGELKYFNSRMFFLHQGELFTEYKSRIMPSLTPFECH